MPVIAGETVVIFPQTFCLGATMDRYAVQDLVRRLHLLEQQLSKQGTPTQTIKDAIKYISENS